MITDYYNLSSRRKERISVTDYDLFSFHSEESYSLDVVGNFSITVDAQKITEPDLSNHEIRTLVDYANIQVDMIEEVRAIDWDPIRNAWEQRYLELIRYKREHGNCEVPKKYLENPPLGHWVGNQRQRYRIGKLSKERVRRLNEIGFAWRVPPKYVFDDYVEQLLEYEKIYGHMNVSQLDPKYRKLGRWLNDQRTKKMRGTLLIEHEDKLNEIGVVWNVPEARWNQRFGELVEFHKKNGHFDISRDNTEYPELYWWSLKLRRKKPTGDRLERLNAIGYDWDEEHKKIKKRNRDVWRKHVNELKDFYAKNGHFKIPYENKALYSWVYRLSRDKLSKEQIRELEEIGFDLDSNKSTSRNEIKWNKKVEELKLFYEANGHFKVPSKENPKLYRWLYKLKTQRPSEERIEQLLDIRFDWYEEHENLQRRKRK